MKRKEKRNSQASPRTAIIAVAAATTIAVVNEVIANLFLMYKNCIFFFSLFETIVSHRIKSKITSVFFFFAVSMKINK